MEYTYTALEVERGVVETLSASQGEVPMDQEEIWRQYNEEDATARLKEQAGNETQAYNPMEGIIGLQSDSLLIQKQDNLRQISISHMEFSSQNYDPCPENGQISDQTASEQFVAMTTANEMSTNFVQSDYNDVETYCTTDVIPSSSQTAVPSVLPIASIQNLQTIQLGSPVEINGQQMFILPSITDIIPTPVEAGVQKIYHSLQSTAEQHIAPVRQENVVVDARVRSVHVVAPIPKQPNGVVKRSNKSDRKIPLKELEHRLLTDGSLSEAEKQRLKNNIACRKTREKAKKTKTELTETTVTFKHDNDYLQQKLREREQSVEKLKRAMSQVLDEYHLQIPSAARQKLNRALKSTI